MSYSFIKSQSELDKALSLCKGDYQRNLLLGYEAISGATLRGTAKNYSARYKTSANNLIARLKRSGIKIEEQIGHHNRRELVIG